MVGFFLTIEYMEIKRLHLEIRDDEVEVPLREQGANQFIIQG